MLFCCFKRAFRFLFFSFHTRLSSSDIFRPLRSLYIHSSFCAGGSDTRMHARAQSATRFPRGTHLVPRRFTSQITSARACRCAFLFLFFLFRCFLFFHCSLSFFIIITSFLLPLIDLYSSFQINRQHCAYARARSTEPNCMVATVTHNAGGFWVPIPAHVTHNAASVAIKNVLPK